jgi:hypothetical protein
MSTCPQCGQEIRFRNIGGRVVPLGCQCVARIGFEPTVEMDEIMAKKFEVVEPMITNIMRRTLPWLLSREFSQSQLPL